MNLLSNYGKGFSIWLSGEVMRKHGKITAKEWALRLGFARLTCESWLKGRSLPNDFACEVIAEDLRVSVKFVKRLRDMCKEERKWLKNQKLKG